MGAGSIILAIIIGIMIGYFIGLEAHTLSLQNPSTIQSNLTTTASLPTQRVSGVATTISTSGNGGTATLLTSSAGTQTNLSWSYSEVPNLSSYLSKLCVWTLSGSTLISITDCST